MEENTTTEPMAMSFTSLGIVFLNLFGFSRTYSTGPLTELEHFVGQEYDDRHLPEKQEVHLVELPLQVLQDEAHFLQLLPDL